MISKFLVTGKKTLNSEKKKKRSERYCHMPFCIPCHAFKSKNQKSKKKKESSPHICYLSHPVDVSHFLRNITRSPIQSSHITICSRLYSRCVRSITPLLSREDLSRDNHGRTDRRSVETRVSDGFGAVHCRSVKARVCKVLIGVA